MKSSNYRVTSLAEWLEIATDGIAAAGRERITREIEAHFAEAVKAHLAQGESEPVAQINALEELGDAKTAGRRFRKRHLTAQEEQRLVKIRKSWTSKLRVMAILLFSVGVMATLHTGRPKHTLVYCILNFLGFMIFPMFTFWKLRQPASKSNLYSMSLIELSQHAYFSFAFALTAWFTWPNGLWLLIPLADVVRSLFLSFQSWKKIRKTENPAVGT